MLSSVLEAAGKDKVTQEAVRTLSIPPGVVAIVGIALAAACFVKFESIGSALVAAVFCVALVVISAIDLEQRIIPNGIVIPAGILVLLGNIASQPDKARQWTIAAFVTLLGGVVLSFATQGGIGMGDAKLGFLMGAGLGWSVVGALVVASLLMFAAAIAVLARRGLGARKDAIPFGPFLALGAVLTLLLS
jgi:leader peptidase (prepilin peptidase)/N-methyltransferase